MWKKRLFEIEFMFDDINLSINLKLQARFFME